jgi:hypothetical protein
MREICFAPLLALAACSPPPPPLLPLTSHAAEPPSAAASAPAPSSEHSTLPFPCPKQPEVVARLLEPQLDEISGIVESANQPGTFFVHNDSGDSPRIFAIDLHGRVLAELQLPTVPIFVDAEEIAAAAGPDGRRYLYLGDTGNNFASMGLGIPRRKAVLYKLAEPQLPRDARALQRSITDVTPIVFTFPDGARDVEAFFVDPRGGDLYLITKESDGESQLLSASATQLLNGGGKLREAGQLQFGKPPLTGSKQPTAASISSDGARILLRTYSSIFLFERGSDESVPTALARAPRSLPAPPEAQGESITFADEGRAYVTISEGDRPKVYCGSW